MGRFKRMLSSLGNRSGAAAVAVVILIYLATGVYTVGPDEQGVVRRFGRFVGTTSSGLHYHLPFPVETVRTPKITQVKRLEIGFRTISAGPPAEYQLVPAESQMLTGDENIVTADVIVQYRIKDAKEYLFNVKDPDRSVRAAAEAALRQVVGRHTIDDVLTTQKFELQEETMGVLQEILDTYGAGISVVAVQLQDVHPPDQVLQAFRDVASAREDKMKFINEAEGYRNDVIPTARGEAQKMLRDAEAFKESRITRAKGDVANFEQVLAEYKRGTAVTRKRLYLETMEKLLPGMEKYVLDTPQADGLLKFLDLRAGGDRNQAGTPSGQ
ncbi:MAG: FtsH protease activity modulator HflK [Firmicutes bacterium]|nr:FtsH protease activity modulator HflK [Bacillota bacterium]